MRFLLGLICGATFAAVSYLQWPWLADTVPGAGEEFTALVRHLAAPAAQTASERPKTTTASGGEPRNPDPAPVPGAGAARDADRHGRSIAARPRPAAPRPTAGADDDAVEPAAAGQEAAPTGGAPRVGTSVVWDNFRSEATARGFAGFIARKTGRRFEVQPVGLGHYRVVYHYASEADRQATLAAVNNIAGHGIAL